MGAVIRSCCLQAQEKLKKEQALQVEEALTLSLQPPRKKRWIFRFTKVFRYFLILGPRFLKSPWKKIQIHGVKSKFRHFCVISWFLRVFWSFWASGSTPGWNSVYSDVSNYIFFGFCSMFAFFAYARPLWIIIDHYGSWWIISDHDPSWLII